MNLLSAQKTNYTLFHPKQMSLITIDQFAEFSEDYPELAQCYPLLQIKNTSNKDAVTGWDDFEEDWRTHA